MKFSYLRLVFLTFFIYFLACLGKPAAAIDLSQCPLDQNTGTKYTMATPISCGAVNAIDYIAPGECRDPGTKCGEVQSSAFTHLGSYPGVVWNHVEGVKGGNGQNYIELVSGNGAVASEDRHLLYRIDGNTIKMVEDTTFSNSEVCADTNANHGKPVFQRTYGDGQEGAPVGTSSMSCGAPISYGGSNKGFIFTPPDSPYPAAASCSQTQANHIGSSTDQFQLIYQGAATCNGKPKQIIAIQNTGGAGAGEVYFYCLGEGLCAFYEGIDFTIPSHQPAKWTADTDVCGGFDFEPQQCKVPPDINDKPKVNVQGQSCDANGNNCSVTFSFDESLKPLSEDPYKVANFNFIGTWLETAWKGFTPRGVQRGTVHNKIPKVISKQSIRCIYDSDGKLKNYDVSHDVIQTKPIDGLNQIPEYAETFTNYFSTGKSSDLDNRKPALVVNLPTPSPNQTTGDCPPNIPSGAVYPNARGATGENIFDPFSFIKNLISSIVNAVLSDHSTEIIDPQNKAPYTGDSACAAAGCPDSNTIVDDIKRPGQIKDTGGFIQAMMPADSHLDTAFVLHPDAPHSALNNQFNLGEIETHIYQGKTIVQSHYTLCSSLFQSGQRSEKCGLLGNPTQTPTPAPLVPNITNDQLASIASALHGAFFNLPPGFTTSGTLTQAQLDYLRTAVANLAACHGAGVAHDPTKCPAGEPSNVWATSQLGDPAVLDKIINAAQTGNPNVKVNPVLIVALGIEETHFGDAGQRIFGCGSDYGLDNNLNCVINKTVYPTTGQSYLTDPNPQKVLCIYAYGSLDPNCDHIGVHQFPGAVSWYVNQLTPPSSSTTPTTTQGTTIAPTATP